MALVKSRDTTPELVVRRLVHGMGYRYRLHVRSLPGAPDLVFPRLKKVLFVSGCFWHMHHCGRCRIPTARRAYWVGKLERNAARDKRVHRARCGGPVGACWWFGSARPRRGSSSGCGGGLNGFCSRPDRSNAAMLPPNAVRLVTDKFTVSRDAKYSERSAEAIDASALRSEDPASRLTVLRLSSCQIGGVWAISDLPPSRRVPPPLRAGGVSSQRAAAR